jgi:hypothetical protein
MHVLRKWMASGQFAGSKSRGYVGYYGHIASLIAATWQCSDSVPAGPVPAGMTVKFFPLFFRRHTGLSPEELSLMWVTLGLHILALATGRGKVAGVGCRSF